ncbi:DUF4232 domain-containing protein [Streptomyces sp. NPDC015492]|uniref:DUF4232 domain-containing protein n=1 Tax=Streptomyces sp. NPDC015492 TaxID=3364958 RepID=UPI0036FFC5A0
MHRPEAPNCTPENSTVSFEVGAPSEVYYADLKISGTGGEQCSIYGFPEVKLYSADGTLLNSKRKKIDSEAPLITVTPNDPAEAVLEYESGPVGGGGSGGDITCGADAVKATVTDQDTGQTWTAQIKPNPATTSGRMIICEPATSVTGWK